MGDYHNICCAPVSWVALYWPRNERLAYNVSCIFETNLKIHEMTLRCIVQGHIALLMLLSASSALACNNVPLLRENDRILGEYKFQYRFTKKLTAQYRQTKSREDRIKICDSIRRQEQLSRQWLLNDNTLRVTCPDFWQYANNADGSRRLMQDNNKVSQDILISAC